MTKKRRESLRGKDSRFDLMGPENAARNTIDYGDDDESFGSDPGRGMWGMATEITDEDACGPLLGPKEFKEEPFEP